MLGPVLDLLLDAVDMAATVVVVLAMWDGRRAEVRRRVAAWLAGAPPGAETSLQQFIARARTAGAARLDPDRSLPEAPPRAGPTCGCALRGEHGPHLLPGSHDRGGPERPALH